MIPALSLLITAPPLFAPPLSLLATARSLFTTAPYNLIPRPPHFVAALSLFTPVPPLFATALSLVNTTLSLFTAAVPHSIAARLGSAAAPGRSDAMADEPAALAVDVHGTLLPELGVCEDLLMATAVAKRDDLLQRLAAEGPAVRALGVRRLALFGSFVRDEGGPGSDVDLLVEFVPGRKTYDNFVALATLLEETLQRRVELVTLEALSAYIGPRILAEAQDVSLGS